MYDNDKVSCIPSLSSLKKFCETVNTIMGIDEEDGETGSMYVVS